MAATATITIEVENLDELIAAAGEIDAGLPDAMRTAVYTAAKIIATEAHRRAPKKTGRMAASIHAALEGNDGVVIVDAVAHSRKYPGGYAYPRRIEFQEPFVAPAVTAKAAEVGELIESRITEVVDAAWGR